MINIVFRVCAKNPLRELGINYVYYLCPIKNLESILKFGIFSRNEMIRRNMVFYDYSEHSIQERRKENGYHDMVPTFFNTRNAMTFRWEKETERDNWSFVILRVNTDIVEEHICYVSDKTVAYNDAKPIILTEESLKEIEINKTLEIRSFYDDEIKKQRAGAELIIYENVVDTGFIDSIIAKEKDTKYVQNLLQETKQYKELLIDKSKEYFFYRE